ncbi:serine/threonine protein kinase [Blastococcus sp. MG754426]|uniref:serine/threonine-protein kinase n=1 Tax=unclassified Blastococcus TaxID=2619396 RepID=UPI001EF1136F|nr:MULTISPECIES: serine/threonine-protein kinase [unclassified Blastococcus]MCF6508502.1 serine/threonine protein kinase [Blastococcus sp. MG754426]MCF6513145.1 serine/threonine protein kinase [Blastococcus sp. MG754427]
MTPPGTGPGRLVAGRYRLEQQIGGGGMGTVWLARDERLGRQVAVKQVLLPLGAGEEQLDEQRQRALREGRIAARLTHPHAISVYDVALEDGVPWLVMEYLPSRSLAEVLATEGLLPAGLVAQIGAQVADALAATHAAGIVHRDVKPANVLIGEGGRAAGLVKITDFGISHASGDVTLTRTGQITGTPAFLAPEVAQGQAMTEASDVFSLGATLYTCLEGLPPFGMQDNPLSMLHRVAAGRITPPQRAGALTDPLLRMLDDDPGARPPMTEVRDELARLAAGRDGDPTTVLVARTDLRPAGPSGTAVFAAGASSPPPASAGTPVPVPRVARTPAPPAAAAAATAAATAPADRRGRRRGPWVAAGVGIVALLGALGIWLGTSGGDPDATAASPTTATSEAPTAGQEPTATQPEEPAPPVVPPPADEGEGDGDEDEGNGNEGNGNRGNGNGNGDGGNGDGDDADPLTEDGIRDFVEDYHEQVIEDPARAWERTGPTLRANISRADYIRYWEQFEDVRIRDIRAADGETTATATMELRYADGRRETGPHRFTFLVRDGQLILDSDFPA